MGKILMFLFLFVAAIIDVVQSKRIYSYQNQCDKIWGSLEYASKSGKTICQVGDIITCVSMVFYTNGIKLSSQNSNPQTLNDWLLQNAGYNATNYVWTSIESLGFRFGGFIPVSDALAQFNLGYHVLLFVDDTQWVLMNGYEFGKYTALDPTNSTTQYSTYFPNLITNAAVYQKVQLQYFENMVNNFMKDSKQ